MTEAMREQFEAYFSADPANGDFITHQSLGEAIGSAAQMLVSAQDDASEEGWLDEPPQICYGVVLGSCVELEGSRRPAPEGSEFSALVDYRLTQPEEVPAYQAALRSPAVAELVEACQKVVAALDGRVHSRDALAAVDASRAALAQYATLAGETA